jgi:hypothetical protein
LLEATLANNLSVPEVNQGQQSRGGGGGGRYCEQRMLQ